jgi:hypothetical protein
LGSFETWRAAEEKWIDDNLDLLDAVYQWFLSNGEWPEIGPLQHAMYQRSPRIMEVQKRANARPAIPGQFSSAIAQSINLGARHLLNIPGAEYLLSSTVKATQVAVEVFLAATPGEQTQLRSEDLGPTFPGISAIRNLVPAFVFGDHPTPFAGGTYGDGWTLGIDARFIMDFEGVKDPNDYVARQLRIIERWCEVHDARQTASRRGGPFRAFIVMPFGEEWSATSRQFIDNSVSAFGSDLVAYRADDSDVPGRITDQIINSLEESDLVISDITGNNANVGWELGFAYAQSKPCVIIKRRDASSAPFDIYDQRRVDYSPDPTDDEKDRLTRMIRASIEQIKSSAPQENLGVLFKGS